MRTHRTALAKMALKGEKKMSLVPHRAAPYTEDFLDTVRKYYSCLTILRCIQIKHNPPTTAQSEGTLLMP